MITIVDYKAGNLRSVANAFEAIGYPAVITDKPSEILKSQAIVLPGVGAFGDGMRSLHEKGLFEALNEAVLVKKIPYLGICLGLQFLAEKSYELGEFAGFGWLKGEVHKISPSHPEFRVPHMGWNNIKIKRKSILFDNLSEEPVFYFVHIYHSTLAEGEREAVTAVCEHDKELTAAVSYRCSESHTSA